MYAGSPRKLSLSDANLYPLNLQTFHCYPGNIFEYNVTICYNTNIEQNESQYNSLQNKQNLKNIVAICIYL